MFYPRYTYIRHRDHQVMTDLIEDSALDFIDADLTAARRALEHELLRPDTIRVERLRSSIKSLETVRARIAARFGSDVVSFA
jgi:hypothetical protein